MPGTRENHASAELMQDPAAERAPALSLEGILDPERVVTGVEARSKKHALDMLSEVLANGERPLHKLAIFEHLVNRERLGSTAIGCGVAIPHARLGELQRIRAAFLRFDEPVDFDAADGKPVHILFGLLVPEGDEENHLRLLSTIARMLASEEFRKELDTAGDADELYDLLTGFVVPESDDATDSS